MKSGDPVSGVDLIEIVDNFAFTGRWSSIQNENREEIMH